MVLVDEDVKGYDTTIPGMVVVTAVTADVIDVVDDVSMEVTS